MTVQEIGRAAAEGPLRPSPFSFRVPMGPFPARLRAGDRHDFLDIVVGQVTAPAGVAAQWEQTDARLGLGPATCTIGSGRAPAIVLSFRAPADAPGAQIQEMVTDGALAASTLAAALIPVMEPSWTWAVQDYGIGIRDGAIGDPRRLLRGASAPWPGWDQ